MQAPFVDDVPATLVRTQLLGHLAAACRLAMQENQDADAVEVSVCASTNGMQVDCILTSGGEPLAGWGQ